MIRKITLSHQQFHPHPLQPNRLFPNTNTQEYLPYQQLNLQPPLQHDIIDLWNQVQQHQHQSTTNSHQSLTQTPFQHTQPSHHQQSLQSHQQDFIELWNRIQIHQQQHQQPQQHPQLTNLQQQPIEGDQSNKQNLQSSKSQHCQNGQEIIEKNIVKETNLKYPIDYHVVHKCIFVSSQLSETYSCFGLKINPHAHQNHYVIYSLENNQQILHCSKFNQKQQNFIFTLSSSDQIIAKMTLVKNRNKQFQLKLYQIKLFDKYENKYIAIQAYVQNSDAYLQHYCYCNTVVSLIPNHLKATLKDKQNTQSYLKAQIKQYKMRINKKKGKLTSYINIQNILSSPFNCCLEDEKLNSIFMLGLAHQNQRRFIVKIGGPGSLLVAMGTAVSRIFYIDSFRQ